MMLIYTYWYCYNTSKFFFYTWKYLWNKFPELPSGNRHDKLLSIYSKMIIKWCGCWHASFHVVLLAFLTKDTELPTVTVLRGNWRMVFEVRLEFQRNIISLGLHYIEQFSFLNSFLDLSKAINTYITK